MISRNRFLACIIRQYGTGLYRACVSLDKNSAICLSTYQDEASAMEMINRFLEGYQQGEIRTIEDVSSFIASNCTADCANSPPPIEQDGIEMAA